MSNQSIDHIDESVLRIVPRSVALDGNMVPFRVDECGLHVAFVETPTDDRIRQLEFMLNTTVVVSCKCGDWIDRHLLAYYADSDVDDASESETERYYWPKFHSTDVDGRLHIKVSVYEALQHWSGYQVWSRDDADYEFWCWVTAQAGKTGHFPESIVPSLKEEFQKSKTSKRD